MASRKRTIGLAYAATGGAKVLGALVQLAVLPIAARALGAEAFGLLFTVAALASFPLIAMAGFSPAASVLIAKAKASSNDDRVGAYFWSLLFWSVVSGFLLSALTYAALTLFNLPGASDGNLARIFLMFLLANFIAAPIDGTRAAFGESHYNSAFAILGSATTLLMVIVAANSAGTGYYFAAIYLAPALVQVLNLAVFVIQHGSRVGMPRLDGAVRQDIVGLLAANVQAQGGMVLYLHGGVYVLAALFGTAAVAIIGAFVRVAVLVHSMLLALFSPVLPTLTQAVAQDDQLWLAKSLRNLAAMALLVLFAQAAISALVGGWIARELLGIATGWHIAFFAALALFIFCYSATHLLFLTRLAAVQSNGKGAKILVAAFVGLVTAILVAKHNVPLFLVIQAISMAAMAMAVYGRELWRVGAPANRTSGE